MKISIRLMGLLKEKEPSDNLLEVPDNSSIDDVLSVLQADAENIHVFTVNGQLQRDKSHILKEDDELVVFPPVGGG